MTMMMNVPLSIPVERQVKGEAIEASPNFIIIFSLDSSIKRSRNSSSAKDNNHKNKNNHNHNHTMREVGSRCLEGVSRRG